MASILTERSILDSGASTTFARVLAPLTVAPIAPRLEP